jgi:MarR family transcriptional regulator, organic hydroperoxide resistance regulator
MSTVSKLFPEPSALQFEHVLSDLVLAINHKRQSILSHYGVGEMEVQIIRYLNHEEQKKMKEVGEHFQIKLSTLTSTIDKLEKGKLVKRRNSKDDRRVIFIKPTAKGQKLLADLDDVVRSIADQMVRDTNAAEFESMLKGMERVLAQVKGF